MGRQFEQSPPAGRGGSPLLPDRCKAEGESDPVYVRRLLILAEGVNALPVVELP